MTGLSTGGSIAGVGKILDESLVSQRPKPRSQRVKRVGRNCPEKYVNQQGRRSCYLHFRYKRALDFRRTRRAKRQGHYTDSCTGNGRIIWPATGRIIWRNRNVFLRVGWAGLHDRVRRSVPDAAVSYNACRTLPRGINLLTMLT